MTSAACRSPHDHPLCSLMLVSPGLHVSHAIKSHAEVAERVVAAFMNVPTCDGLVLPVMRCACSTGGRSASNSTYEASRGVRMETVMTTTARWTLTAGLICACCLAGTSNAERNEQLLKLLQLQTLNRMASDATPTKNKASNDSRARQDRDADSRWSQPQPDTRSAPGNAPARKP